MLCHGVDTRREPRGVKRRRLPRRDEQGRSRGGAHVRSSSFSSRREGANRGPRRLCGLLQRRMEDSGISRRDERDRRRASQGVRDRRAGDQSPENRA
ncbi:unnamed protein product [Linum tenue]|uniref:Uncharacterized protein n=1 Tax=Linum tenue TaxID=586396 RepID=A0AAV0K575_9ROSI|nr:unnamed protein product [Linum tenue]